MSREAGYEMEIEGKSTHKGQRGAQKKISNFGTYHFFGVPFSFVMTS